MVSPKSRLLKAIVIFLGLLFSFAEMEAQCNPPDQEPSIDCEGAPLVCLTNACYETLNNDFNCCNGFCGNNTAIHNPQFFQFVPTCPDVVIQIYVESCESGNALQAALIGACPWDNTNVLDCDPGTGVGGTMFLEASGLTIGQIYWLLIDGSSGATCNYTISFIDCVFEPGLENELDAGVADPDYVCQGYDALTLEVTPPVGNAHGYYWVVEWLDDTITSTLPTNSIEVPEDLDPGVYQICARAFSGCDTSDVEVCFEVEVYEIPDEIKPPATFCPEEFPFDWGSETISGPGEYFQSFTTDEGCFFDSSWVVEIYPEVPLGILDTLHCAETLLYEGENYDAAGTYELFYPGMGLNGCDSMAELNVTLAALEAEIVLECQNGEFELSVLVQDVLPNNSDLEYEWYESGILVSTDAELYILDGGNYRVTVCVVTDVGNCCFDLEPFSFNAEDYRPDPPDLGFTDTIVCGQPGVIFTVIDDPADFLEYVWSGPPNVPIDQDGSNEAEFDFSFSGPAEICVYAINECGPGEPFCFMVDIKTSPVAAFTFDPDVCAGENTTITFTGTASSNAELIWDFDNPTNVVGTGIGPYTIDWAVPGIKTIQLTVIEPGCDTSVMTAMVTVSTFQPPVVNCTSTISSVFFEWDDVIGASGYLVSINGAPPVATATSEWLESPLTPGTIINMTLTVVSAGPCPDIVVMASCTAEDCPPPVIVLSGQDSSCLNSPAIIDLDALVNGLPGVGTWAGPGITDANLGYFDPRIALAGQHQIVFTTDVNGCSFNEPYLITVFDSITADFVIDPEICIEDAAGLTFTGNGAGSATYDFDFGSATVLTGTGPGPYQLTWATPGTKTVRLQVSENGCSSDIISHTTNVVAALNPPVINCSPNTSGILFSWVVDNSAANDLYNTIIGSGGTLVGNDSLEFTGLVPGDIVEIEIITVSAGPCPDRRDTLQCEARLCPSPVIVLTPVDDICLYPGTGIVALEVDVTNGAGSGVWAGPGVVDVVNGRFDPVVAGAGAHLITYNYDDDGCDFVESITINVYDVPEAFVSNTDLMITCLTGSIDLDGSSSSGGPLNYLWSTGNGVFGTADQTTPIVNVTAQGIYQLKVTNAVSGCVDSTSVTVTQDANIPIADAGPDKTITCDSLAFTLGGSSTTGVNIVYSWNTPTGSIVGPTNGIQVNVNDIGEYNIVVRDTSNGCQSTDRAIVDIDQAVADITLTPGDTIDCNTTISTATSMLSEPVANYDLLWTTTDGTIVGSFTGPTIDVSQGGTYTLTIENRSNGCQNSEVVFIPESDEIIDGVDVSLMNIICHGDDNGALTINSVDGGAPPYTYQWSVSPTGGNPLTSLGPGFYSLTVSDQNGCTFTQTYEVSEPDLVTVDVGPDRTVAGGDSVSISLSTNVPAGAIATIDWGGYDGLLCPGCPTIDFIAASSATITAMISDTAGCTASDSMRLTVIVPRIIFIPNVFSPNDDGNNDFFFISGRSNLINVAYLRIYDRWGNQVFEKTNIPPGIESEGWDGTFNGEAMQPGVYAFTAKLDYEDISEVIHGDVTIIR